MANYCSNRKVNIVCVLTLALGLLSIQRNKIKWNSVLRLNRMYRLHMAKSMVSMQLKAWVSIIAFTLWKIAAVKTQDEGFFRISFLLVLLLHFGYLSHSHFYNASPFGVFFPSIPLFLTLLVAFFPFIASDFCKLPHNVDPLVFIILIRVACCFISNFVRFYIDSKIFFFSVLFFLNFSLLLLLLLSLMSLSFLSFLLLLLLLLQRIKILLL